MTLLTNYRPLIRAHRRIQESLLTDSCVVLSGGMPVTWPRNNAIVVPCRFGDERTFAEPSDPQDANTRASSEWAISLPWDMPLEPSNVVNVTLSETGEFVSTVVGETNKPQTWLILTRGYGTRPKSAVAATPITFKRDTDDDGEYETTVGTYLCQVIFDRVDPLEVPLRYAEAGRSSYAPVRIVIPETNADVQIDDIFLLDGNFGVVRLIAPGQTQQTEVRGLVDFGGIY